MTITKDCPYEQIVKQIGLKVGKVAARKYKLLQLLMSYIL